MIGERRCAECGVPLAPDQSYCLECGGPVDDRRLERLRPAPAVGPVALVRSRRIPRPGRLSGLVAAAIGVGIVTGSAVSPAPAGLASAPAGRIVVQLPAPAPAPAQQEPAAEAGDSSDATGPAAPAPEPVASEPLFAETPAAPSPPPEPEPTTPAPEQQPAHISHVFVVAMNQHSFDELYGDESTAKYLKTELAPQGVLLSNYRAIGHRSLVDTIAMVSGQEPKPEMQDDCADAREECHYAADVTSLPDQLVAASLTWRAYIENSDNPCAQPAPRNPFAWFHSVTDSPSCTDLVVPLEKLDDDLKDEQKTPNYTFIGADGHADEDAWLKEVLPKILGSDAYKNGGLVILTSNEAPEGDPPVGALLLSPTLQKRAGTTDEHAYDHYSLLRTVEDLFALDPLGKAADAKPFRRIGAAPQE